MDVNWSLLAIKMLTEWLLGNVLGINTWLGETLNEFVLLAMQIPLFTKGNRQPSNFFQA